MTAKELMEKFSMSPHPENGAFVEKHFEHEGDGRASSGSIYYYVAPNEHTAFHKIDCDEYWCYVCGSPLTLCCIDEDGTISYAKLGIEEDCSPMYYFKKGVTFASINSCSEDGTFVTCITVPRFTYDGFEMFSDEEILAKYPEIQFN